MSEAYDQSMHGTLTTLTMAAGVTMGGMTLGLTERYGKYKADGWVVPAASNDSLMGSYAQGLMGVSVSTLVLAVFSSMTTGHRWYKDLKLGKAKNLFGLLHGGTALTLMVLLAAASLNIYVLQKFEDIDSLTFEPADIEADQKLRGDMGWALFSMAIVSIALAGMVMMASVWYFVGSVTGGVSRLVKGSEGLVNPELGLTSYAGI